MGGPKLRGSRTRKARAVLSSSIAPRPPSPAAPARRTGWWWRAEALLLVMVLGLGWLGC